MMRWSSSAFNESGSSPSDERTRARQDKDRLLRSHTIQIEIRKDGIPRDWRELRDKALNPDY
jgi:hypothetical protein